MGKVWLNVSRIFLLAVVAVALSVAQPSEAAMALFGTSEEADVTFEATDISVDYDKVTIKGNFKNNTDYFQRVTGYTMYYIFFDEEGVSIIDGAFKAENLSIDVGTDLVPYTVTVENKQASMYDVAHITEGWKVRTSVKLEK